MEKAEKASKIIFSHRKRNGSARLSCEYESGLKDDLYLSFSGRRFCAAAFFRRKREYRNVTELGVVRRRNQLRQNAPRRLLLSNENPRIYEVMTFPVDYRRTAQDAKDTSFDVQAGNRWADPGVVCERIGAVPTSRFLRFC